MNLSISGNKENGIHCVGSNNHTKIILNSLIGYNKKAGIKSDKEAHIFVHKNSITKNFAQVMMTPRPHIPPCATRLLRLHAQQPNAITCSSYGPLI